MHDDDRQTYVDVYRVGLLYDVWYLARTIRLAPRHATVALRGLCRGARRSWRRPSWRSGWHAEAPTDGGATRVGRGWTQRRAIADLHRHVGGQS